MRTIQVFIAVLILSFVLPTCASTPTTEPTEPTDSSAGGVSLIEAIERSANRIATELPAGSSVAILAFETDSPQLSAFIMEELAGELFDRGVDVADRQNLDIIYQELAFHMSGAISDTTAQSIGKFLGADMVITGQMRPLGSTYRFTANAIRVERATPVSIPRINVRNDRETQEIIAALNRQGAQQSELAIAEARLEEIRAATQRIGRGSSATQEAQAVAALAAEALAAAERAVAEANAAEALRRAEEERVAAERRREEEDRRRVLAGAAPQNLRAASVTETSVNLSWNPVSGDYTYHVYYGTSPNSGAATSAGRSQTASHSVGNLTSGATYFFWVTAVDRDLESPRSEALSATTATLTPPRTLNSAAPFYDSGSVRTRGSFAVGSNTPSIQNQSSVMMAGIEHRNGVVFTATSGNNMDNLTTQLFTLHNLNGQFRTLSASAGRVDGSSMHNATLNIYGDGRLLNTYDLRAQDLPIQISMPVDDVRQLRIEYVYTNLPTGSLGGRGSTASYAFVGTVQGYAQ